MGCVKNESFLVTGLVLYCFMIVGCGGGLFLCGLVLELEERYCMRDLIWILCFLKDLGKRISSDCGLVIRSRGRWGKCG